MVSRGLTLILVLCVVLMCCATSAWSHGYMVSPQARAIGSLNEDYQYCFGTPDCLCGEFPDPGPVVATYMAGETITVQVNITQTHTIGVYYFQLCSGPLTLDCLTTGTVATVSNDLVLGNHSYQVTLPENVSCDSCVLRWKWDYGFLSCADIRILPMTPVASHTWGAIKALYVD
jgi:hypothetical protein